jgi:transcriptional antiterminator NusG
MSHPTDEIPDSVPPGNGTVGPDEPPTLAAEDDSPAFEVEEQTPDGGQPSASARPAPEPEPEPEDEPESEPEAAPAVVDDDDEKIELVWYVLKVQSSREDTIRDALERRVKIQGLQPYFGRIVVPTEKITEIRNNKKRVVERKTYPGYIMV